MIVLEILIILVLCGAFAAAMIWFAKLTMFDHEPEEKSLDDIDPDHLTYLEPDDLEGLFRGLSEIEIRAEMIRYADDLREALERDVEDSMSRFNEQFRKDGDNE